MFNESVLFTTTVPALTNVDPIVVSSLTPASVAPGFVLATVWSGMADLQEGGGATYLTADGYAEEIDAHLVIDASPLPDVAVGHIVTNQSDGKTFSVVAVATQTFAARFLEIILKRGGLTYRSPK